MDNPLLQPINTILGQVANTASQYANNIPMPQLPNMNVNLPNMSDISSQWQTFLQQASQSPDIVNYYNNLLQQAQGDTNMAIGFLEKDYQTGVRQTQANLQGTLAQLGLTFTGEQNQMQNTLNQRGIALTQGPNNTTQYAGGGQPATELGQLNQSQQLRQEAEQRSASQGIENMGLTRQKGITSAGQQLQQYGTQLNQQKQQDVLNRASMMYGGWQNQQYADAQSKANQNNAIMSGSATPPTFKPDTVNQTVTQNGVTWKGNPNQDWSPA